MTVVAVQMVYNIIGKKYAVCVSNGVFHEERLNKSIDAHRAGY